MATQISYHQLSPENREKASGRYEYIRNTVRRTELEQQLRKLFAGLAADITAKYSETLYAEARISRTEEISGFAFKIFAQESPALVPIIIAELAEVVTDPLVFGGNLVRATIHRALDPDTNQAVIQRPPEVEVISINEFLAYLAWVIETGQAFPIKSNGFDSYEEDDNGY